ncbi:MAG TPA: AAA family ATPase [Candidatus Dormibacteraeota bacterium]|jgi:DNA-binding CsgD family transcriptional regulator|nr:AAA family ATPase [Candidatus Dormibacteraeota bacterium]
MSGRPRFVGRVAEIAAVEVERHRSAGGELRCILLSGDPGSGKTRLAEECLARAAAGSTVLTARARPLSTVASFGVWAEAFEEHLRQLPPEEVAGLCGGFLDDLAGLLRSVAGVRRVIPDREPPRIRFLESLGTLLTNLARRRPVVLHLDDMHLADASSWEVLEYLALHFSRTPALVIAGVRPGELADQPLAVRVLLDLEQQEMLRRIDLEPLGEEAVELLAEDVLGRTVGKDVLDWVAERSRGNTLFAVGLLRALRDEGGVPRPGLRVLPEELAERVRARVGLLDPEAQRVLEVLAVAGGRVELGELVRFCGRPLEELAPAVRRLTRTRLVAEDERAHRVAYEVAHPMIAETIYDDIGGATRFALHRQVGRALLIAGHLGEAALHFARSADSGDDEAIAVLRDALRQAEERGGYREALKILGALAEILPPGDARWLAVAATLDRGEWVVDHRADADTRSAVAALREIDAVLAAGSGPALRATVKSRLTSFLSWGTGQLEEAAVAAEEAIRLYRAADEPTQARLAALELAYARGLAGDLPALEQGARTVLAEAEQAGDEHAAVQALGVLGTATFYQGRFVEGAEALGRSVDMARQAGKLYRVTWGLMSLGWMYGFEGRFEEAHAAFEEARSVPGWRDSNVLELESHVRWLAGDYAGALACAHEAVVLNPGGLSRRRAAGLCFAALSAVETAQLDEARRNVATVARIYGDRTWFVASGFAQHAAGVLAWHGGRLPEAISLLRRGADALLGMGAVVFAAPLLLDLAEVSVEAGLPAEADCAAAELERIAAIADRDLYRALAGLGRAWALIGRGQHPQGEAAAREAATLLPEKACASLRGRSLVACARALETRSCSAELRALAEAASTFESAGALWRRDRTLEALRARGRDGLRAADAVRGAEGITVRELQVARLAAQRLTAKEIGDRLFISRRTVEAHLARVYVKLGVASKGELARRLTELTA